MQEIAWETFEHILGPEIDLLGTGKVNDKALQPSSTLSRLVSNPLIKRVDIYDDHLTIEFRTPWDKVRSQKYIGLYSQKYPDRFSAPASEPTQQSASSDLRGNPLEDTLGTGKAAVEINTLANQVGVTRKGRTSHLAFLTNEGSSKLHKQADHTDPTQQSHGINELLQVSRAPGLRWLQVPCRDFVSLKASSFRVLPADDCIGHQIHVNQQHRQVVANQDRSLVSPLRGHRGDAQPLRTNPLSIQRINLAALPQSFRSRSYPLSRKVVDLEGNGRSHNLPPLIARNKGCRVVYSPNWLDELPYKLGSSQPIGNQVFQLAKSNAKPKAANTAPRAKEALPPEGGHDSYGLPGGIEKSLATHAVPRDGKDGTQPPSPQFVTLSAQGRLFDKARLLMEIAGASCKDSSGFRLQGVVTTYSTLANSIPFNSLQASRLDGGEEGGNLQFSPGLSMSNSQLRELEKAFKEEVVSAFESDVFCQERRWKWGLLDQLLEGLNAEKALPSLIDDSVLLSTGLKAEHFTEGNTGSKKDQDDWEDVFPALKQCCSKLVGLR